MITTVAVITFVAYIAYPKVAIVCLAGNLIGRIIYSLGYTKCGPHHRIPGAIIMGISNFIAVVAMICSLLKLTDTAPSMLSEL